MKRLPFFISLTRINIPLSAIFLSALLVDIFSGDLDPGNFPVFSIPLGITLILSVPYLWKGRRYELTRPERLTMVMAGFVWMVLVGSLPFIISGALNPEDAVLESVAGFTTTAVSATIPSDFLVIGRGLLFYRVAIQWAGGLFYLTIAFLILTELNDLARRSVERRMLSRVGMVPKLSAVLYNVLLVYTMLTVLVFLVMGIMGRDPFDSLCIALATVSTGGYSADGRLPVDGTGILFVLAVFMVLSGVGYHVHLSFISARGRLKTFMDRENVAYIGLALAGSFVTMVILLSAGRDMATSFGEGPFTFVSALTTTGFMVRDINSFPDSAKVLFLIAMLIGASSFSVASGMKIQRVILLLSGLAGEVRRSAHSTIVRSLRRGEGFYSEKALESASVIFLYTFFVIGLGAIPLLFMGEELFETLSLIISSVTNTGMAFGTLGTTAGIRDLGVVPKLTLAVVMVLGRFELLLPMYFLDRGLKYFKD